MILITVVDNNMGLLFNNRRLSKDEELKKMIYFITNHRRLAMCFYSLDQFNDDSLQLFTPEISITNVEPSEWTPCDFYFNEIYPLKEGEKFIDKIILFKWNRDYPSDTKLEIDLSLYNLIKSSCFSGKSHNKITIELYERKKSNAPKDAAFEEDNVQNNDENLDSLVQTIINWNKNEDEKEIEE